MSKKVVDCVVSSRIPSLVKKDGYQTCDVSYLYNRYIANHMPVPNARDPRSLDYNNDLGDYSVSTLKEDLFSDLQLADNMLQQKEAQEKQKQDEKQKSDATQEAAPVNNSNVTDEAK